MHGVFLRLKWLQDHVDYDGEECLIFPFRRYEHTGYAPVWDGKRLRYANNIMCELAHGPAPTPEHESAHSCDHGHDGCVHPKHLSWKTHGENQRDRRRNGTANTAEWAAGWKSGKLTPTQVIEIRALAGTMTQQALADRFGVSRPTINHILNGKTWSDEHIARRLAHS